MRYPFPNAKATGVWEVKGAHPNQSAPRFSQFSAPSFGNTKCLQTFSLRHKASPSLLAPLVGWTNSLRQSLHLRCCCRKRFQFAKWVSRSLRPLLDLLARAPAPSCKHPTPSQHPLQNKKWQARSLQYRGQERGTLWARPISNCDLTNSSAASAAVEMKSAP